MKNHRNDVVLASVVAIGASLAFSSLVHALNEIANHWCIGYQLCRSSPPCPTVSGECDSCTEYEAWNEECREQANYTCINQTVVSGGCGYKREGTCGANNICDFIITSTLCNREDCSHTTP
jgi:hypothetical protein